MDDLIRIERRKLRKSASRHVFEKTGGPVVAGSCLSTVPFWTIAIETIPPPGSVVCKDRCQIQQCRPYLVLEPRGFAIADDLSFRRELTHQFAHDVRSSLCSRSLLSGGRSVRGASRWGLTARPAVWSSRGVVEWLAGG